MAILLLFEIPNTEWQWCLHDIWCESRVLCSFCHRRTQKIYEQTKEIFLGFSTKTRTSVNGFSHADPAMRARTQPARASVQRSLLRPQMEHHCNIYSKHWLQSNLL